jgi:hypothetical protein
MNSQAVPEAEPARAPWVRSGIRAAATRHSRTSIPLRAAASRRLASVEQVQVPEAAEAAAVVGVERHRS